MEEFILKSIGKFVLLDLSEFSDWLSRRSINRKIVLIQHHHTYIPSYKDFAGDNHFNLCQSMEKSHIERGFDEIAQNFTTFPDGSIMICRNLNKAPAGIKGANSYGICIENVGNFDQGADVLTPTHKNTLLEITRCLLVFFKLRANENTVVYHHWYDLHTGDRIDQEGDGTTKSCPGTAFFGGNTVADFKANLLPLLTI